VNHAWRGLVEEGCSKVRRKRKIKNKKNKKIIIKNYNNIILDGKEEKKARIRIRRASRRLYNYIMTFVV